MKVWITKGDDGNRYVWISKPSMMWGYWGSPSLPRILAEDELPGVNPDLGVAIEVDLVMKGKE